MTDFTSLIEDLQEPAALPDRTTSVSVVQTHISIVFLADHYVYKVKKPVDFGFLDFSTLEKRRHFCEQEVTLNSRLSRDVYLGVLPVLFDGKRHHLNPGPGEVVDYAVRMRRIPQEVLMRSLFERGGLTLGHLKGVARTLAAFHREAGGGAGIDVYGRPESFKINTDENFQQVARYVGLSIRDSDFKDLRTWTDDFYRSHEGLFARRIAGGRIRDCHGDLHMEHVCLLGTVSMIDCIEFNQRFRYSDTLADLAFLLMDLEFHGGRGQSGTLWEIYREEAAEGEEGVEELLNFYKVYRAFVRGKVNSFQIDDPSIGPSKKEEAAKTASRYFRLARSYL